jgi:hypothetical protein
MLAVSHSSVFCHRREDSFRLKCQVRRTYLKCFAASMHPTPWRAELKALNTATFDAGFSCRETFITAPALNRFRRSLQAVRDKCLS